MAASGDDPRRRTSNISPQSDDHRAEEARPSENDDHRPASRSVNRRSLITRGGTAVAGLTALGVVATAAPAHAASPTGAAGGSLTGSYPNPGIGNATIGDQHIDSADPIGRDKIKPPEPPRLVGTAGQPAFGTGWSNVGLSTRPLQFWYDPGSRLVHIEGSIKSTGAGGHVFSLPTGYGPPGTENVGGIVKEFGTSVVLDWSVVSAGVFMITPATAVTGILVSCSFRVG